MDNESDRESRWTMTIVLALIGTAIAAGAYYWFEQIRAEREAPPRPSPEWTTAPEGGVEVDLPETPMTNVPPPAPGAEKQEEARSRSRLRALPDGA